MKTISLSFFILCLFSTLNSNAQATAYLDVNNVTTSINAAGYQFCSPVYNSNNWSSYYLNGDSLLRTIYSHSIWIAATKRDNGMHCVAGGQMTEDYYPGPIAKYYDSTYYKQWNKVWKISKTQIDSFKQWYANPSSLPTYTVPDIIQLWPAHGITLAGQSEYLAPFYDNNNDGYYNCFDGDYPLIKGDMAIWTVINDEFSSHISSEGNKLGFQIEIMAYAYDCDNCAGNTIYLNYKIRNLSNDIYDNTIIGFYNDFDIGNPYDDYVGTDIERAMVYCYNSSDSDYYFGKNPPAQGMIMLKGIERPADGLDNPKYDVNGNQICDASINGLNYADGIPDNEINTLYASLRFLSNYTPSPFYLYQPRYAAQIYDALELKYINGAYLTYGGIGYDSSNTSPPSKYFAFGESDPCYYATNGIVVNDSIPWYEHTHQNLIGDPRMIAIADPFSFYEDNTVEFDLAFVYARDSVSFSIPALQAVADTIIYNYRNDLSPCNNPVLAANNYEIEIQTEPIIYPNPVEDVLHIAFDTDIEFEVYDISGKTIKSGFFRKFHDKNIDVSGYPSGMYIIKISSENQKFVKKFIR